MSEENKEPKEDSLSVLFGKSLKLEKFRDTVFSACLESYLSVFTNKELEDGITQTFRGKGNGKKIVLTYKLEDDEQTEG